MIQKIQQKPILAVLFIAVIGVLILILSKYSSNALIPLFNGFEFNFYTKNILFKAFILLYSIAAILLLNSGTLKGYGFTRPKKVNYFKLALSTAGIAIAARIVGVILFVFLLNKLFPMGALTGFPEIASIIQYILIVWIWSSFCEEVLTRGLVQSFLTNLKTKKLFKLSVPVLISGLFFGFMHFTLLATDMSFWFVCSIIVFASSIGILAAYHREKSESIIPAFYVHFVGNIVGTLPLFIKMLIS